MILSGLLERRAEKKTYGHPSNMLSVFGSADTFAGVQVTPYNALQLSAIYAAVRVRAESMAVLSCDLYKRLAGGGKDLERDHAASWLLREDANAETTAFIFRETLEGHVNTWGNGYAEIEESGGGEPLALWQRRPDRVEPERPTTGSPLAYRVTRYEGDEDLVPADRMLHVPGLSFNGLRGFSPIEMQRETVGRGMAVARYRSAFFGNRMQFNGFVTHPGQLPPEGKEEILDGLEQMHKATGNAFRAGILDEGMDWKSVGFPNDQAQMLETAVFEVQDVARWFRIPPHLLAELTHATFTNIEHQDLEFIKYSLLPSARRWETELNRKLLTRKERELGLFFEFNMETLLRGDFESRMKGFATGISHGIISPNEARAKDNWNPYEGGDVHMVQLNMQAVSQLGEAEPTAITERTLPDGTKETRVELLTSARSEKATTSETLSARSIASRFRLREVFERLLVENAQRLVAAEVKAIRRAVQKLPTQGEAAFRQWLEDFFEQHEAFARVVMAPILLSYMEAVSAEALEEMSTAPDDFRTDLETFHDSYVAAFAARHAGGGQGQVRALLDAAATDEEAVETILARVDEWEQKAAGKIGLKESTKAMNAISVAAYAFAGVTVLRWVWNGGECGICPHMDGKVVEIGQPFARVGDKIGGEEDGTGALEIKQVRGHPPLHKGCICGVGPG